MKRFFKIGIAVLLLAALASCASDKNGEDTETTTNETTNSAETTLETVFDYENSDISGMVTLGDYKGIDVTIESALLTEEEFESAIDNMLSGYAHYEKSRTARLKKATPSYAITADILTAHSSAAEQTRTRQ